MTTPPLILIPTDIDTDALSASRIDAPVRRLSGATMGTGWSLSFAAPESVENSGVVRALETVFATIINQMSGWERASHLSQFNQVETGWRVLPDHFFRVLTHAIEIAEITDGAFQPALGGEVARLGFGPADGSPAATNAGWRDVRIDAGKHAAYQPGGVQLDLSAIGKGHAVDVCAAAMAELGAPGFLMEIGGEFVGRGVRPDGRPWLVEIELSDMAPAPGEPESIRAALCGCALATSGDFVRRRNSDGGAVSHILDGRTGKSATQTLSGVPVSGVSVVAETCMEADAWATALFALGLDAGEKLASARGLAAIFATRTDAGARYVLSDAAQAMASEA